MQKNQTQFVYGCWLGKDSHTDEHIVREQGWVFPHANSQETDRRQELVGGSCRRHGMDTVENRGNEKGQATKGYCSREERTNLERTTASYGKCRPGTAVKICCAEIGN